MINEPDTEQMEGTAAKMNDIESSDVVGDIQYGDIENDGNVKDTVIVDEEGKDGAMTTRDVTETTTQSYGSNLKDSCSGVCFGFILYFCSISLLIWNEGRTVKRMKDLDEGRETVIEFDLNNFTNASVPTAFENKLIHAIGDLNTPDIIMDPIFGVASQYGNFNNTDATDDNSTAATRLNSINADNFLKLSRSVSTYQWKETKHTTTKKNSNGSTSTTTTYSYSKAWSSSLIASSRFHQSIGHMNPGSFPFEPFTIEADLVYLGNKIVLNDDVVSSFDWYETLDTIDLNNVPDASLRSRLTKHTSNGYFYQYNTATASSAAQPNIGDTRIFFEVVLPDTVSIIARLYPDTDRDGDHELGSHSTAQGSQLLLIERGVYTAEEMFVQAENDNTATAWILRIVGFFLMVFSILLILQPLATIVDIVPFVGDFIQSSMENCLFPMIAVIIALPTCLFVIALAWLAYRPAIAIPIMLISLCFIVFFYWKIHIKKQEQNNSTNGNDDTDENADADPIKPNKYDCDNNDTADTYSPFNSPGHNNINIASQGGGKNEEPTNAHSGGSFADALDHPSPPYVTTIDNGKQSVDHTETNIIAEEEDIVLK